MFIRDEFLLDTSGHLFEWLVSLTLLELVLLRSLSYTLRGGFYEEFLLHSLSWFLWGVSLTLLDLVSMRSFSYIPRAGFSEELHLQFPDTSFSEEFHLHASC